jgi:hypothetical protein
MPAQRRFRDTKLAAAQLLRSTINIWIEVSSDENMLCRAAIVSL